MAKIPLSHQRISKILDLSMGYKRHKQMLNQIQNRSQRNSSVMKSERQKLDSLVKQRNRYKDVVKKQKSSMIKLQNRSLAGRIVAITSRCPSGMRRSSSMGSVKSLSLSYPVKNNPSRKSEGKPSKKKEKKDQLMTKLKKIDLKDYGFGIADKEEDRNKEYKRSIRKFSEKNKNIRTSLLEQGLKIERDYFLFLPNLKSNKKSKSKSHSKRNKA